MVGVVPRRHRDVNGLPSIATSMGQVPQIAKVISVSACSGGVSSSRLEIIQEAHTDGGFSAAAARRMAGAQEKSSLSVDESRWQVFCGWCKERHTGPVEAGVQLVAEFLVSLYGVKDLAYTISDGQAGERVPEVASIQADDESVSGFYSRVEWSRRVD